MTVRNDILDCSQDFRYPFPSSWSIFSCDPMIIHFAYKISNLDVSLFQYIKQIPEINSLKKEVSSLHIYITLLYVQWIHFFKNCLFPGFVWYIELKTHQGSIFCRQNTKHMIISSDHKKIRIKKRGEVSESCKWKNTDKGYSW